MHIDFKRVVLHNFMSFGHSELKFLDDGFIRVSGINENPLDNAVSNGSGKSSLWESIIWALTGDTNRGTKHVVNMYGDDGCFVELEFVLDNKLYKLIRSKDHKEYKTNLQIYIDGVDCSGKGIRDSEKLLTQYLPDITPSLLSSVIILGQGLPQKFTNNTPSGRKEVLETLSKSDFMIEDLKKRVTERKTKLQTEQRKFEDDLIAFRTKEELLQKQIEEKELLLKTLDSDDLLNQLEELNAKLFVVTEQLKLSKSKEEEFLEKSTKITSYISELTNKKNQDLYELVSNHNQKISPYKDKLSASNAEHASLKKQLAQIKSVKDVCPTCGQKLPDVHKPDTTALEVNIQTVENSISETEEILKSLDITYKAEEEKINSTFITQTKSLRQEQEEINNHLSTIKQDVIRLSQENNDLLSRVSSIEVKLAQLHSEIDNCKKIIRENNENLTILAQQILYNNEQKDLTQSHLEVINKFSTALNRDFRGYLLSTIIDLIQAKAKQYSKIIFDTDQITFCLDGNNIDISYMNKPYENLSGGEQQKIDLIIQFSIRDMLSIQLGFTSNILVLDEVFDGLDTQGCTRVTDMIASLSDVKNIFIVTHRKDLSIPTDKELIVLKSSVGISELHI